MKMVEMTWSHILSRKLSSLREERGLTQVEIARRIGCTQNYISSVFSRREKGTEIIFRKIGQILGLTPNEIDDMVIVSMVEAIEAEYPRAGGVLSNFYK